MTAAPHRTPAPHARRKSAAGPEFYDLVLYISGATPNSQAALANVKHVAETQLKGRYRLTVVDVYQEPERGREHGVIAAPALVRTLPRPLRRMIGDLSSEERVLIGLGLVPAPSPKGRSE